MDVAKPATFLLILGAARQQLNRFAILMGVLNLCLPLGLLVYAKATSEPYWRLFRGDYNLTEWFSSVQLLLVAAVAYLNHRTVVLWRRFGMRELPRHPWIWGVFALGFVVFALDERFNIHEALRDDFFEPSGVFVDLPWLISGDVGLYLFFLIGLAFTPFLWDELRRGRLAVVLYLAALALTLPTIVIDGLPDRAMVHWPAHRFWDYTFEELGEVWAQFLFLLSFLAVLSARLAQLDHVSEKPRGTSEMGPAAFPDEGPTENSLGAKEPSP